MPPLNKLLSRVSSHFFYFISNKQVAHDEDKRKEVGRLMLHGLILASGTLSNVQDVYRLYFVQINFYAINFNFSSTNYNARLNILDKFSIGVTSSIVVFCEEIHCRYKN